MYGRTGHFEEFSIANIGPSIDKSKFQLTYFPGLYSYVNWKLDFFNVVPYISYGEIFKVHCKTVHELYRSNLVCPLIPILKAVFWSKFEEFSTANIGPSIEKIQIPVNILPKIVQLCCLDQKTALRWESMDIPDLTCTARAGTVVQGTLKNSP